MGAGPQGRGNIKRVVGCAAERCLRQIQRGGAGAAVCFLQGRFRGPQQKQGTATRRFRSKIKRNKPKGLLARRANAD